MDYFQASKPKLTLKVSLFLEFSVAFAVSFLWVILHITQKLASGAFKKGYWQCSERGVVTEL